MPYVPVPKDLSKIKTKVALNLTKRQLICFSSAAVIGVPVYIFTKSFIGTEASVLLMIGAMLPFFFTAMYEKDGQPAEKVLRNIIRTCYVRPSIRLYRTDNLYKNLTEGDRFIEPQNKTGKKAGKPPSSRKNSGKKK